MKANEVMIGDWVMINPISYYQVEQIRMEFGELRIYLKSTEVFATENEIMPIPLTPEILEKNGFVNDDNNYGLRYYQSCCDVIGVDIRGDLGYLEDADLKYVHRLQHALRLCGIEKEIIL